MFWIFKKNKNNNELKRTIVKFRNRKYWFNYDHTQILKIKDSELKVFREVCERSQITLIIK